MKCTDPVHIQYLIMEYERIRKKYSYLQKKPLEKIEPSATMKADGSASSGNYGHSGRPGKVGGSTPTPSARGANVECIGFADSEFERRHIKKHLHEYGNMTADEYIEHAKKFLAQPCSDTIDGYLTKEGEIVRFDRTTGEYAKGVPGGRIITCYIAKYDKKTGKANLKLANRYFDKWKRDEGYDNDGEK